MYYALDIKGNRTFIVNAEMNKDYLCPICNEKLIQKKGKVNSWHFAHKVNKHCDDWYQMSDWHLKWQEYFPENFREVVVKHNNERHRADIKIGNLIIEFQNSSIGGYEFDCRTNFYTQCGVLVWVFNLQGKHIYEQKYIQKKTTHYYWDWAYKFGGLKSYGIEFDLFFQIKENELVKVVWNKSGFKYFGGYKYSKEEFMDYLRRKYKKNLYKLA